MLSEELQWRANLGDFVWDQLAGVAGVPSEVLKSDCIAAAHLSFHFIWRRFLFAAGDYPWFLTLEDLRSNLLQLLHGPCPDEPVSQQLWFLMNIGFPIEQLISCL